MQKILFSCFGAFLPEKYLIIWSATLFLHMQPLLNQLNFLVAWLWVQFYEFAFLFEVEDSLASTLEIYSPVRAQSLFEEYIAVNAVIGLQKGGIILINVLLWWNKGQFCRFQAWLIAWVAVLMLNWTFGLLQFLKLPILPN